MKKNKTIAYMLAATLLVGGTFAGTKAWFTDKDVVTNDIIIATGVLDVAVDGISDWSVLTDGTEAMVNSGIINLKPEDQIGKHFTVKNNGSLEQKINVKMKGNTLENSALKIRTNIDELQNIILQPGESKIVQFNIEIDPNWEMQGETFDLNTILGDIVIEADQTSAHKAATLN